MNRTKQFIARNFEAIMVFMLVAVTAFTIFVVVNKVAFLNVFYVPVLVASYFLGSRKGVLTAVVAVLLIVLYAVLDPQMFSGSVVELPYINILLWGAFIIVTSYVVGTLYEAKEHTLWELRQAYEGIVEILGKFIDAVDKYTKEHSVRVSQLAVKIAEKMKMPPDEIENIRIAGLLHDVGKIEISVDVLRKASALSAEEWEQVKTHTIKASSVLKPIGGLLKDVVPLIMCHHEYFDGGGYHKMACDQIPMGARILAVADAYDSIITDRPYRAGRSPWEAALEIEEHAGTQFDADVVKVFSEIVQAEIQYA